MNSKKLNKLQAQVRIGGKGTPRRKKKVVHRTAATDDKKLQNSDTKVVNNIPGIEIMVPTLTTGAIDEILNGEDVPNAVLQILGCKLIPGTGNDRYQLLISDGVSGCPFTMLGTQLNYMVANKELELFTIVRVDKYVCFQVQGDRKVIILLSLTVLVAGNEVNEKIGNPMQSPVGNASSKVAPVYSTVNGVSKDPYTNTPHQEASLLNGSAIYPLVPMLTIGAINRILNGEDVPNAVLQVIGCKNIPGPDNDRYRLVISDGVTGCPFAMLGIQLNYMVADKQLEKFTIVQVDKCVCIQVQVDLKVIILLSLTVLAAGNEVNEKIGNPINSDTRTAALSAAPADSTANGIAKDPHTSVQKHEASPINGSAPTVQPINTLTPYKNKWTIKARVTSKTPLRIYSNSHGEGKVFSVNLLDESGEITASGFNDVADKYYDFLEPNKVYYISKATLKTANARFSTLKNDYAITFNNDTTIVLCEENFSSVPMLQFDFLPIAEIEQVEKDTNIDASGICKSTSDLQTFMANASNRELTKTDIKLADCSNKEINVALSGKESEEIENSIISTGTTSSSVDSAANLVSKDSYTNIQYHETFPMDGSSPAVHPINTLTLYENKWTIKARVTNKTPLRSYSILSGEREGFSVNLLDESGEIKAFGFNDVADKYYDFLEPHKVYYFSNAALKTANLKFSTVKNDYEITFNNDTTIVLCEENSTSFPMLQFDFVPIAEIEQVEKDTYIDVIGICRSASDLQTFVGHASNRELIKRDIKLVDCSNKEVNVALWGKESETFDDSLNPVIAVKGARVSAFNGKSLTVTMSSTFQLNPDIKEAHILKEWFERKEYNLDSQSISSNTPGESMGIE